MSADSENLSAVATDELSSEAVAEYLKNHPDFFVGRDNIIEKLTIPHESGQAISLIQRQVQVLRESAETYKVRIQDLINNANTNDSLFEKTRLLILALLKADSLESLNHIITTELSRQFDTVENHLIFIGQNQDE